MATWVTDITHFPPLGSTDDLPKAARELRDFLGRIISAATARTNRTEFISGLPCRAKIGRSKCQGTISIRRQDLPTPVIHWQCTNCDEGGDITGWRSHAFDLSKGPAAAPDEDEKYLSIELSQIEFAVLLEGENPFDSDSQRIILAAERTSTGVRISAWEGDMDNLIGFIASNANHTGNKKLKKQLLATFDKIQSKLYGATDERGLT
jgi:hypothetical protein